MNPKSKQQLRRQLSKILVKWNMPTRQSAISEIMQAFENFHPGEVERTWWVTDHDTNTKIAGPFTTSDDAAQCRYQLEKREDHHNYWLEQFKPTESDKS